MNRSLLTLILLSNALIFTIPALANDDQQGLSNDQITAFCTDKPIWSAFAIPSNTCIQAATLCAKKEAFHHIDPSTLSEPYYECVFDQLGISIQ
jgi:hypothetical protein